MSNSIGRLFTLTTAGESHGLAMVAIIDGCPSGMNLSQKDIQHDLNRRRPGQSCYVTQRQELDQIKILSGVFEGKTTGMPIALLIENQDQRPRDYGMIAHQFRPGHADYTYVKKYGLRDYRGSGRASARETAMWVAAGAIAKKYLYKQLQLEIRACVRSIGNIEAEQTDWQQVSSNPFHFPDGQKIEKIEHLIHQLKKQGESIGAMIFVEALNVPLGLGDPVFNKLDADIAKMMMSINAVKAVGVGDGWLVAHKKGSEHRDEMTKEGFLSNHAGGILGGISTGQPIQVHIAIKPASSIRVPAQSLDESGNEVEVITQGRHDPCVGIRAVPIAEAVLALVLMDAYLCQKAYEKNI